MRVLVISDISSYMRGGVPTETRALLEGMSSRGHTMALASDAPLVDSKYAAHYPLTQPTQATFADQLRGIVASFKPDFVHAICMSSRGVMKMAPLLELVPWAVTVHSVPPYERKLNRWHNHERLHYAARAIRFLPNSLAWRWIFRQEMIPKIIVHSDFVERILIDYGCSSSKLRVIALPFDADEFSGHAGVNQPPGQRTDSPRLVTVAGITHTKGQHDMVKAMPVLLRRFPNLTYQMIGEVRDRSYLNYLQDLAAGLEVSDRLLITPDLNQADKSVALQGADLYVQPSHEEGFCLAYAEAAAVIPRLIGTRTGAIAALSQGDAGARVIAPRDPMAIASAITELLQTDLPNDHLHLRVQRLSTVFATSTYLQAHEDVYNHLRLEKGPPLD